MQFIVSSSELLHGLVSVSRVIASKSVLAILDDFLFELKGNTITVTASDGETTLKTTIEADKVMEEGSAAIPAKLLTDSLKEFPDQPLTFKTVKANGAEQIEIVWANGASKLPCGTVEDYPRLPELSEDSNSLTLTSDILLNGINNTVYATAEEELRPVMNGIFFDISNTSISMVASDAHKLVCYTVNKIEADHKSSFILHKKPASILKQLLTKADDSVSIKFDAKNAYFEFDDNILVCRLIEGNYPAYRTVIPKNNPNKMIIGRVDFLNSVKRIAVCSNQASSHVKLKLSANELIISAEDVGFAISAHEKIVCQYDGDQIEIGFKAPFLAEILSNLPFENVCMELADNCRAVLIVSADEKDLNEDLCALLMPVMLNA